MVDVVENWSSVNKCSICVQERDAYLPLAEKGSKLFFVISDLCKINNMYRFSLASFLSLFQRALQNKQVCVEFSFYASQQCITLVPFLLNSCSSDCIDTVHWESGRTLSFSVLFVKRSAGKNVSKFTYFVSGWMLNLNSIRTSVV